MKNSIYLFGAMTLFVLSSFITVEHTGETIETLNSVEELSDGIRCYEFIYPLSYFMPDETVITGNDADEISQQIKDWYAANPDEDAKPQLGFPITVILDGNEQVINDEDAYRDLREECRNRFVIPDEARKCIEYVNPLVYELPDGTEVEGKDLNSVKGIIKDWYAANPGIDVRPVLQFPIEIIIFGQGVIVENEEELRRYKAKCKKRYLQETSGN
jgi:hypothetical protein